MLITAVSSLSVRRIWDLGYAPQSSTNWVQQTLNGQPTGYLTKFKAGTKLAFLTVHGAGHEVRTSTLLPSTLLPSTNC